MANDATEMPEGAKSTTTQGSREAESNKNGRQPRDGWDKLQSLSPLITGIVLAVFGYFLTGSVNEAIQKSQLQFNYVKEMQDLLTKLNDPKTTLVEGRTDAVALAAFGSVRYTLPY